MATSLNSFIEIFNTSYEVGTETTQLKNIAIPIIQRDYAQGRMDAAVDRIRADFLDSLHNAILDVPITLDFVYGDIDKNGVMTPLDGQQRLTALFLLHWYAAKKEKIDAAEHLFLENFTYETRYSARDFCSSLIDFDPAFSTKLSEEIVDQAWFPLDWKKDQTVSSMLVMLDAIDDKFKDTQRIWERLKNNAITFYFLPIRDMGLTDELYIKMNSRGKPLTQFEHFKAELERELRKKGSPISERIIRKIDVDWTDMLWQYRGKDNLVDDEFLRYFKFICDIICYQNGETTQGKSNDEFDLLKEYFSSNSQNVMQNIDTLEKYFDCWDFRKIGSTLGEFLETFISNEHQLGKIKIDKKSNNKINIFEDCVQNYGEMINERRREFPLNRLVLLYAIISYLLNRDSISDEAFSRRLRIVNNLIQNSEDEISDRKDRNGMPAILRQVKAIITTGAIDQNTGLNQNQLQEEIEKNAWLQKNQDKAQALFELEDHELLHGQIQVLGWENPELFPRFQSLFSCDNDLVDCALLSIGNYGQREKQISFLTYEQAENRGWRYQLGSKWQKSSWENLFHKTKTVSGFERTGEVLVELLSLADSFTDELLREIISNYTNDCEVNNTYDWRYYYIKYEEFRPGKYGKYFWYDLENRPYEFSVMATESKMSEYAYQPFLKAVYGERVEKSYYGQRVNVGENFIVSENSAYVEKSSSTDEEIKRISIAQNDEGIDTEDRIKKLKSIINQIIY